jgi:hypothetical protein
MPFHVSAVRLSPDGNSLAATRGSNPRKGDVNND